MHCERLMTPWAPAQGVVRGKQDHHDVTPMPPPPCPDDKVNRECQSDPREPALGQRDLPLDFTTCPPSGHGLPCVALDVSPKDRRLAGLHHDNAWCEIALNQAICQRSPGGGGGCTPRVHIYPLSTAHDSPSWEWRSWKSMGSASGETFRNGSGIFKRFLTPLHEAEMFYAQPGTHMKLQPKETLSERPHAGLPSRSTSSSPSSRSASTWTPRSTLCYRSSR